MEKFFEIFKQNIKTERLEMRILAPTPENAKIIWDVLKNENPQDFKYMYYSMSHNSYLPESLQETQDIMMRDNEYKNGFAYYIFNDNKFIGYMRIHYWAESRTLQCASVWFIKSAWGKGFNKEIHNKLEDLAFNKLHVNRICRQTMAGNLTSKKSIESGGYHLDGIDRQSNLMPDGTFMDHLMYSKLFCEYNK
jgi:RimJ/RimL family protein N-acetyltransferase